MTPSSSSGDEEGVCVLALVAKRLVLDVGLPFQPNEPFRVAPVEGALSL
jgi:hypothetical protein